MKKLLVKVLVLTLVLSAVSFCLTACTPTPEKPEEPLHEHTYVDIVVNPTCTEQGYTEHKCFCNDSYKDTYIDKLDHKFANYVYNNDSKCGIDGTKTATCDYGCGESDTVTAESTALSHKFTNYIYNNDAKCGIDGTKTATCAYNCGEIDTIIAENTALDHVAGENGFCVCGEPMEATPGVVYDLSSDGTYYDIIGYDGAYTSVNIASTYEGKPVKTIYKEAFKNNDIITTVIIPDSVEDIGSYAFYWCSSLQSVVIGDSVEVIGESAFSGCNSSLYTTVGYIKYVKENNNPYYIAYETTNKNLSTYTIQEGTVFLGYGLFSNCERLSSVIIPDSVKAIGTYAFFRCSSLQSVVIGDSVKAIGTYAFSLCSSLQSVTIGDSVKEIGESAFYGCDSLTSIVIPDSVESIGNSAFYNCDSLTSIVIPDSVTSIGNTAFYNCDSLTSVNYLGTIDEWVQIKFSDYYSNPLCYAKKLYINGELVTEANITTATKINSYAFRYCDSLQSVVIGDSVKEIGEDAFSGCSSLQSVNYLGTIDEWVQIEFGSSTSNPLRYAKKLYINGELVTEVNITTATKINAYAFSGCYSLQSVVIGDSVKEIGEDAFSFCSSLTSIKYRGTMQQWDAITKGSGWNSWTGNYTITYNYTGE